MKAKKLLAVLVVLTLVIALAVPAFAANNNIGTITIKAPTGKSLAGRAFTAYELFTYNEKFNTDTKTTYNYTPTDLLKAFLLSDTNKVVTGINSTSTNEEITAAVRTALGVNANKQTFTNELKTFLDANPTIKGIASTTSGADAVFADVDQGYYAIYETGTVPADSATMLAALDTTDATINIKTTFTDVEKTIVGNSSFAVGDTVNFKIDKTNVPNVDAATTYTYTDTMSDGLTYNSTSLKVNVGGTDVTNNAGIVTSAITERGFTLTIHFDTANLKAGDAIVITYSATVNENATNENTNTVAFNDEHNTSSATAYTYGFDVQKQNEKNEPLSGAHFSLSTGAAGTNPISFTVVNGKYVYDKTAKATDTTTDLVSGTDGLVHVWGLNVGTYYLTETVAPDGYNKLTAPETIVIAERTDVSGAHTGYSVTVDNGTAINNVGTTAPTITVVNTTGIALPSTGGMGNTLFTITGCAILAASAAYVVINRKKITDK